MDELVKGVRAEIHCFEAGASVGPARTSVAGGGPRSQRPWLFPRGRPPWSLSNAPGAGRGAWRSSARRLRGLGSASHGFGSIRLGRASPGEGWAVWGWLRCTTAEL
jgi:hypothetical protein